MWFSGWIERFLVAWKVSSSYFLAFQVIWPFFHFRLKKHQNTYNPIASGSSQLYHSAAITANPYLASYDWRISIWLDSIYPLPPHQDLKAMPDRISRSITITHAPDFSHLGSLDVQIPVAAIWVIHLATAKLLDNCQSVQVKVRKFIRSLGPSVFLLASRFHQTEASRCRHSGIIQSRQSTANWNVVSPSVSEYLHNRPSSRP